MYKRTILTAHSSTTRRVGRRDIRKDALFHFVNKKKDLAIITWVNYSTHVLFTYPSNRMKRIIANGDGVSVTEPGYLFNFFYRFPPFRFLIDLFTYGFGWHGDIVLGKGAYSKRSPIAKGRGRYFYLTRDVHCLNLTVQETYVLYTQGHKIRCRESLNVDGQILDEPIKPYSRY